VAEVVAWAAGTAIAVKTPISVRQADYGRSMGGFASHERSKPRNVDPELRERGSRERDFFGATVRYANAAGAERVVSIVGTGPRSISIRNHISWVSPLGTRLMSRQRATA